MHLLILTQYFWPENFIINDVSRSLVKEDLKITVLTGKPNYPVGEIFDGYKSWGLVKEKWSDVQVYRVPVVSRGKNSSFKVLLNYISFILTCSTLGLWTIRKFKFDSIIVYAPSPILQAIPAIIFSKLFKLPLILWVQDLWPESLQATENVQNRFLLAIVRQVVYFIYKFSSRILVQSEAFKTPIINAVKEPEKIFYFPNPAFEPLDREPSEKAKRVINKIEEKFSIVFAGNLGAAQGLNVILEAASLLKSSNDIKFFLVGAGNQEKLIEKQIKQKKINNIELVGWFNSTDTAKILKASSCLLVTLLPKPIFTMTVPSKVQTYLMIGRPIIASLDGEGAKLIESSKAGLCSPAGCAGKLAENIIKMEKLSSLKRKKLGLNGRMYYENHFAPELLVKTLITHVTEAKYERQTT